MSLSDRTLPPCTRGTTVTPDSCAPYGVCLPVVGQPNATACTCPAYRDPTLSCLSLYHIIPIARQYAYLALLFILSTAVLLACLVEVAAVLRVRGPRAIFKRPTGYVILAVVIYAVFKLVSGVFAAMDTAGGEPVHVAVGAAVHLVGENVLVLAYMGAATVWMRLLMRFSNLGELPRGVQVAFWLCIVFMGVMVVNIVLTMIVYTAAQVLPLPALAALQTTIGLLPLISVLGISVVTGPLRWRYLVQLCRASGRQQWKTNKHMRYFYARSILLTLTEMVSIAYAAYIFAESRWLYNRAEVQQLLLETTLAWQIWTSALLVVFAGNADRPRSIYARAFGCRTDDNDEQGTGMTPASTSSTVQSGS